MIIKLLMSPVEVVHNHVPPHKQNHFCDHVRIAGDPEDYNKLYELGAAFAKTTESLAPDKQYSYHWSANHDYDKTREITATVTLVPANAKQIPADEDILSALLEHFKKYGESPSQSWVVAKAPTAPPTSKPTSNSTSGPTMKYILNFPRYNSPLFDQITPNDIIRETIAHFSAQVKAPLYTGGEGTVQVRIAAKFTRSRFYAPTGPFLLTIFPLAVDATLNEVNYLLGQLLLKPAKDCGVKGEIMGTSLRPASGTARWQAGLAYAATNTAALADYAIKNVKTLPSSYTHPTSGEDVSIGFEGSALTVELLYASNRFPSSKPNQVGGGNTDSVISMNAALDAVNEKVQSQQVLMRNVVDTVQTLATTFTNSVNSLTREFALTSERSSAQNKITGLEGKVSNLKSQIETDERFLALELSNDKPKEALVEIYKASVSRKQKELDDCNNRLLVAEQALEHLEARHRQLTAPPSFPALTSPLPSIPSISPLEQEHTDPPTSPPLHTPNAFASTTSTSSKRTHDGEDASRNTRSRATSLAPTTEEQMEVE
ncbi:hypothetical protein JCM5350_002014 [Sporobolomyces pararoseus]